MIQLIGAIVVSVILLVNWPETWFAVAFGWLVLLPLGCWIYSKFTD